MGELDNNQPKAVGSHAIGPNSELQRQIAAKISPKDSRMLADQSAALSNNSKASRRKPNG